MFNLNRITLIGNTGGDRRTRRQGNRPERHPLPHPRRSVYASLHEAGRDRLSIELAVCSLRGRRAQEEGGQQDEIYLPHLWRERLGQAGRATDLWSVLRGRGRNHRYDARACARQPTGSGLNVKGPEFPRTLILGQSSPSPAVLRFLV